MSSDVLVFLVKPYIHIPQSYETESDTPVNNPRFLRNPRNP